MGTDQLAGRAGERQRTGEGHGTLGGPWRSHKFQAAWIEEVGRGASQPKDINPILAGTRANMCGAYIVAKSRDEVGTLEGGATGWGKAGELGGRERRDPNAATSEHSVAGSG